MTDDNLSEARLYELALEVKKNKKDTREEINKFYTSMTSIIVPIIPFVDKISQSLSFHFLEHQINLSLMLLPIIGITISTNWIFVLKRLSREIIAVDNFLVHIEQKQGKEFIIYLDRFLERTNSPRRITIQEMIIPYTFLIIFCIAMLIILLSDMKFTAV